jgi:hypothetical protein
MNSGRARSDTKITRLHLGNPESTMEQIASASAGMSLLRLNDRYGGSILDDVIDHELIACLGQFIQIASGDELEPDNETKAAIDYFVRSITAPVNELDRVTLYLPKASSYEETSLVFPLKHVFILVWKGLHDTGQDDAETIADRRKAFLDTIQQLKNKPICHQGIRHELLSSLNQIHPDVDFIVSADAFFMQH